MSNADVHVKICEMDKCVYESRKSVGPSGNNLGSLISCLKDTQVGINDFLTGLVEKRNASVNVQDRLTSDSESDFEEHVEVNPKKKSFHMYTYRSTAMRYVYRPISVAQLRYVTEWFQEWSEMQRSDFLSVLLEQCGPSGLVNGLVTKMETLGYSEGSDRPPSLFQCRVKLFREWSNNWSQQEKDSLFSSIKNTDPVFAEKYEEKLSSLVGEERKA